MLPYLVLTPDTTSESPHSSTTTLNPLTVVVIKIGHCSTVQYSCGKPWVLAYFHGHMCMAIKPTKTLLQTKWTPWWQTARWQWSQRQWPDGATQQKTFRLVWAMWWRVQGFDLAPQKLQIKIQSGICGNKGPNPHPTRPKGHPQIFSVHVLRGQSCFGSIRGTLDRWF